MRARGWRLRTQHGISLVEALVALLVMSFGTVALLGVQANLRMNADVAKQRSEAVRLGQEALEDMRSFGTLADFEALADVPATDIAGFASNTTFTRTIDVANGATARERLLTVDVGWADRTGQAQSIRLTTSVHGVPPALAGSLVVASDTAYTNTPAQRHAGIPPGAVTQSDGTSTFSPPGGGGTSWVFNNVTGYITRVCLGGVCTDVNARLLAGYVRFATGPTQPTGDDAEVPPSARPVAPMIDVVVAQTAPSPATVACYEDQSFPGWVPYYCAVPLGIGSAWSGRSLVQNLPLASSIADATATLYRICRYTPERSQAAVAPPAFRNVDHPLDYVNVNQALLQQNFLVIRAGDGSTAFDCPDDTDGDLVDARTWHHQPSS